MSRRSEAEACCKFLCVLGALCGIHEDNWLLAVETVPSLVAGGTDSRSELTLPVGVRDRTIVGVRSTEGEPGLRCHCASCRKRHRHMSEYAYPMAELFSDKCRCHPSTSSDGQELSRGEF